MEGSLAKTVLVPLLVTRSSAGDTAIKTKVLILLFMIVVQRFRNHNVDNK